MSPAAWPRQQRGAGRLLWVEPRERRIRHGRIAELPRRLRQGDLLVVNDAATLPASLQGHTPAGPLELRLASGAGRRWWAVLFGAGDWRQRTEDRPPPPRLRPGDVVAFGPPALAARVVRVDAASPRLVEVRFDRGGAPLWAALYALGRPVQYSYLRAELPLWHVQTAYAGRPWAVELPSAGHPLTWSLLQELEARGVGLSAVTHAAGLSSTGDPGLDARLPLPERYEIPDAAVAAIDRARARGGRVVAAGTTVVRALEGAAAAQGGALAAGAGVTDLRLGPAFRPRVVDGLLTGVHEPGGSHFALLGAFAPPDLLHAAAAEAEAAGYLAHEFGDSWLVLADDTENGAVSR